MSFHVINIWDIYIFISVISVCVSMNAHMQHEILNFVTELLVKICLLQQSVKISA